MPAISPSSISIQTYQPSKERERLWTLAQDLTPWFDDEALETLNEDLEESDGFVAYVEGQLLGFLLFHTPASIPAEDRYEIIWLAVSPQAHAQGIGTALIQHLEAFLKEKIGEHLEIIVWTMTLPSYEKTRRFYNKHGYKDWYTGVVAYDDEDEERLYLRKRFSSTPPKRPPGRRASRREKHLSKKAEAGET